MAAEIHWIPSPLHLTFESFIKCNVWRQGSHRQPFYTYWLFSSTDMDHCGIYCLFQVFKIKSITTYKLQPEVKEKIETSKIKK